MEELNKCYLCERNWGVHTFVYTETPCQELSKGDRKYLICGECFDYITEGYGDTALKIQIDKKEAQMRCDNVGLWKGSCRPDMNKNHITSMKPEINLLKEYLINNCVSQTEANLYTARDGGRTNIYIDTSKLTMSAHGMIITGNAVFGMVKDLNVKAIGGMSSGSLAISTAACFCSASHGIGLNSFVVREKPKEHGFLFGINKYIQGEIAINDRVVLVDDFANEEQLISACKTLKSFGIVIVKIISIISNSLISGKRMEIVKEFDCEFESIFLDDEIYSEANQTDQN